MQKSNIAPLFISAAFFALYGIALPSSAQAQSTPPSPTATQKTVAFRVDVGDLICKDGVGTASVLFSAEPREGGSFEIFGETINENRITLDRRVALKSGTYTWKGVVNEGYREAPPSIGEFTIPVCGASNSVTPAPAAPKNPTTATTQETKKTAPAAPKETLENKDHLKDISITTSSSSVPTETAPASEKMANFKIATAGLIILGIVILILGFKKGGQNK